MGHKIHPRSIRLGYIQDWRSRWFAPKNMPALIKEDFDIRKIIDDKFKMAAVSYVGIERAGAFLRVNVHTARPGVVIGKKGADIEALRKELEALTGSKTFVNVIEIKNPETDAQLVAQNIAMQLEKRAHYGAAMKKRLKRPCPVKRSVLKLWCPADSAARKSPAPSGNAKAAFRCTPCAPILTTVSPKPTPSAVKSALKSGFSREPTSPNLRKRL